MILIFGGKQIFFHATSGIVFEEGLRMLPITYINIHFIIFLSFVGNVVSFTCFRAFGDVSV